MLWLAAVLAISGAAALIGLVVADFPTSAFPLVGGLACVRLGAAIALGVFRVAGRMTDRASSGRRGFHVLDGDIERDAVE